MKLFLGGANTGPAFTTCNLFYSLPASFPSLQPVGASPTLTPRPDYVGSIRTSPGAGADDDDDGALPPSPLNLSRPVDGVDVQELLRVPVLGVGTELFPDDDTYNGSTGGGNSSGANSSCEVSDDDEGGLKRTPSGKVAVRPTLSKMMRGLTSKFKSSSRMRKNNKNTTVHQAECARARW